MSMAALIPLARAKADQMPTTQPTSVLTTRVLVLPFAPSSPAEAPESTAQAVAAHLRAVLLRSGFAPVISSAPYDDATHAVADARAMNAARVVYGSYQRDGNHFRFDGIVVDSQTAKTVANISATGTTIMPFLYQDRLAAQLLVALHVKNNVPIEPVTTVARAPAIQPPYAPLVAMLDRNRTPSNNYASTYARAATRRQFYPPAYGYGGYGYYGGYAYYGGGYAINGPTAVIGATDYSGYTFLPFANFRVGYGIAAASPP